MFAPKLGPKLLQMHRFSLIYVLSILVCSTSLNAQNLRIAQALGLSGSTANIKGQARGMVDSVMVSSDFSLRLQQFGLVYQFRLELIQFNGGSVSIAAPVMAGFSLTNKYHSRDFNGTSYRDVDSVKGGHFAFEVPVYADLNLGLHSAADESGRRIGIYVGAGYPYSYTKLHTSVGKVRFDGFDPVVRAGIRLGRAWETRWGIAFSVRGSSSATRTYGLQLLKEL